MKTKFLIAASALLVILAGGLYALQAPPTVTISPAMPSTIYVNSTTTVTITAQITDSRVIPTGVILLQIDPVTGAQSIVGSLKANGQTFTITLQPVTTAPTLFSYDVSAAFSGLLKRTISLPITVAVAPVGVVLPPDPGPAGMQTLAGIDTNENGTRDDIERWIAVTEPTSARMRAGLTQGAIGIQQAILASSTAEAIAGMNAEGEAQDCLGGLMGSIKLARSLITELEAVTVNTAPRVTAYLTANSLNSQYLSSCAFNPNALPN